MNLDAPELKTTSPRRSGVEETKTVIKLKTGSSIPQLSLNMPQNNSGGEKQGFLSDPQAIADRQFEFLQDLQQKGIDVNETDIKDLL